jgi:antitoxin (DNA-binding transcriptional repressor) of toxin-antitoxin stability system
VDEIGIRELRNHVTAAVRRAAGGERIVVTVDGVAMAQLGPLHAEPGSLSLHDLSAAGLLEPPRAPPGPAPDAANPPVDIRLDRVLDAVRGR